jgi:hypothetical protein
MKLMANGIFDSATADTPAVLATASSPGTAFPGPSGNEGVHGESQNGTGVSGVSHLEGSRDPNHPFWGDPGVYGENKVFHGKGVEGQGDIGVAGFGGNEGIYGESAQGINFGVGVDGRGGNAGVMALNLNHDATVRAAYLATDSYAAYFVGPVAVHGDLDVWGNGNYKAAVVEHPDGSHRRLYCMESPESWFEDFGIGQLHEGEADVRLDHDFAALVHTDSYHAFVTPYGDSNGLFVDHIRPHGFVVREQQGGKHSLAFAYRVVAKRRDITVNRLQPVQVPVPPVAPARPPQPRHHQSRRA